MYFRRKNIKQSFQKCNISRPTKYRPNYEMENMKWEFHKYDHDPFPSVPHGHCLNRRDLKLHENGDIYQGKDVWGRLNKRDYDRLRKDPRFIRLALAAKKFHGMDVNGNNNRNVRRRNMSRRFLNEVLVFEGRIEQY